MTDSSAETRAAPGQTTERLGFFTDAVFAIAMTLLVIEIPRPEGSEFNVGNGISKSTAVRNLWHFLTAQHSALGAYAIAFYLLWIVWREHHILSDQVRHMSGPMVALHFPLLLLVAFVPYPTTIVGHYSDNPLAALFFALVVGGLLMCRSAIQLRADRDDVLLPEVDRERYRAETTVSFVVTAYWGATLAVVWWTPWVLIPWLLTSGVAFVAERVTMRRLSAGPQDDPDK